LHPGSYWEEAKMERAKDAGYSWTTRLPGMSMGDARARVTELLKAQGFGVLTEIDLKATLKQKLDLDFKPYVILGACNPQLASRALAEDPNVGLLLPCNVCLWQEEGATMVAIADPRAMFRIVDNPRMLPIVDEAERRLRTVADGLAR
jgi:uncharacterized protein (DUF302 family)